MPPKTNALWILSYLEQLSHSSPLLFCNSCVLLLDHTETADGQLQLDFDLTLPTYQQEAMWGNRGKTYNQRG